MIFSQTNQSISKALVAAWGQIETPKHNTNVVVTTKSGSRYEFSYTDLEGIFEAIKEVYRENKIAVLQNAYTTKVDGVTMVSVETMLLHESGEWIKSGPLQAVAAQNMQDLGGQITYMKRYSLAAMLGLATEKDDDANGVSGNQVEYRATPQKLSEAQIKRLFAIANKNGFTAAQVKQVVMMDYKKQMLEDLTKQEYDELCERLEKAGKEPKHA